MKIVISESEIADLLDRSGQAVQLPVAAFDGSFHGVQILRPVRSNGQLIALGRCAARHEDSFAVSFILDIGLELNASIDLESQILNDFRIRWSALGNSRIPVHRIGRFDTDITRSSAAKVYPGKIQTLFMRHDARRSSLDDRNSLKGTLTWCELAEGLRVRQSISRSDLSADPLDAQRVFSMTNSATVRCLVHRYTGLAAAVATVAVQDGSVLLIDIYTDRQWRRQGFAQQLLTELRSAHGLPLELTVDSRNRTAMEVYLKFGFDVVSSATSFLAP